MNTGIGDAVNLAWKLCAVLQRRAKVSLLDSYEPERIAFARRLVTTTDRAYHRGYQFGSDRATLTTAGGARHRAAIARVGAGATLSVPHRFADGGQLPRKQLE